MQDEDDDDEEVVEEAGDAEQALGKEVDLDKREEDSVITRECGNITRGGRREGSG